MAPHPLSHVQGVIFDVDGTLVDSNGAHALSWQEALRAGGFELPLRKIRPLIGMGGDKLLPELTGLSESSEEGRRLTDLRKRIFREKHRANLRPFLGARELVQRLRDDHVRMVVASSASAEEIGPLLEIAHVADLIPDRVSPKKGETASKPDPDLMELALKRLGLKPAVVRMIGDTPYDIEAARRAGIQTLAFRCGGSSDEDLRDALAIFDGPTDLIAAMSRPATSAA